ncbi:MAG: hypothetical protein L6V93_04900 [Clostridiales bacterium]|nr:MAG: hypothetical protein L6V93_04900 [Clostridiales bacterium]
MPTKKTVHNGNSRISIEGGTAESVFGGSYCADFIGNTDVSVMDGEILRRIYGGCYNDWTGSWKGDCSVSGTAGVTVGKNAKNCNTRRFERHKQAQRGNFSAEAECQAKRTAKPRLLYFLKNSYDEKNKISRRCYRI